MNIGLILAGGTGERIKDYDKPKQFVEVEGKLLISYCLQAFEECPDIDHICIVAPMEWQNQLGDYIYAAPGKSRQHSIYNGLLAIRKYKPTNVIIHDAARPLVATGDISLVIKASRGYDGATPALNITDTTYRSIDGKVIIEALNRDELFAGQTPECYDYSKYLALHGNMSDDDLANVRGSSEIAVRNKLKIALCEGNPGNFKITTNAELEFFINIVKNGEAL